MTVDRHVDLVRIGDDAFRDAEEDTAAIVFADAGAPKFLEGLPLQPEQVGFPRALGRGPIGADYLAFACPIRRHNRNEPLEPCIDCHDHSSGLTYADSLLNLELRNQLPQPRSRNILTPSRREIHS